MKKRKPEQGIKQGINLIVDVPSMLRAALKAEQDCKESVDQLVLEGVLSQEEADGVKDLNDKTIADIKAMQAMQ